jgi:hypothetical protein
MLLMPNLLDRHKMLRFCTDYNQYSPEYDDNAEESGEKSGIGDGGGHEVKAGVPDGTDKDTAAGAFIEPS